MRQLYSDEVGDLAAIYETDIELVTVTRPRSASLEALASQLFTNRTVVQARWEQDKTDQEAAVCALSSSIDAERLGSISDEITLAGDVLSELLGCERVGIRVTTLNGPMCPRFHIDQVPCRLLITISGQGTEWIPSDDVAWALFADRSTATTPLRSGRQIQQLGTGHWALLKGGAWDEQFSGVVHRSPHLSGERLLLTMDPIFDGRNECDESDPERLPTYYSNT